MDEEYDIRIDGNGNISYIYSDTLAEMFQGMKQTTRRASHVEPFGTGWMADMRPSGGPVLFANVMLTYLPDQPEEWLTPFTTRQAALDAEVAWLRANLNL